MSDAVIPLSFRKDALWVPFLIGVILCAHNPSLFYLIGQANTVEWVSPGAASLLFAGMIFWDFRRCLNAFLSLRKLPLCAIGIFFLIAAGHFFLNDRYAVQHLGQSLLYLAIPLCGLVYYDVLCRTLPALLACVGLYNLFYSAMELIMKKMLVFGISGNINWNASLLILTMPFLLRETKRLGTAWKLPRFITYGACSLFGLFALFLFFLNNSRAGYLSLAVTALLFLFAGLSGKNRKKLFYVLLALAAAAILLFVRFGVERFSRILAEEDRLMLWEGAVNMISAYPLTGVGGASFEDKYVPFKTLEYFFARHAAPRTDHPHNHFLYAGCCFGIPGMLAWLYLLLFPVGNAFRKIWNGEEKSRLKKVLIFVLICGIIHANVDLVFDVFPNMFLFLLILGTLWKENLCLENSPEVDPAPALKILSVIGGSILFLWGVFASVRTAYASHAVRDLMTRKMPASERAAIIRRTVMLCPDETRQNFAMLYLTEKVLHYAELTVYVTQVMERSTVPNYASVPGMRGNALVRLGRLEEARKAYQIEMRNYPIALIPVYNLISVSRLMKDTAAVEQYTAALEKRMEIREITKEQLAVILKNPNYDLIPWAIPVEHGGKGHYGFDQK